MEAKSESGTAPVVAWPRGVEGDVEMWRGGQSILELKLMGHEDELIACGVRKKEGTDRPPRVLV